MLGSKKKEEAFPVNEALLNVITPMGLEIKRNSLVIGENLGKVYGAVRYPQKVDMGWLSKITNIPSTIVSVGITPIDNGSLISAISKSIVQQRGAADSAKDPLTRQRAEKAAEDGEKIMQRIDQEGETVAMMSLTVMPIAQDEVNFTKVCRRVESAFNIQKCKVRTLANLQKEGFQSISPTYPANSTVDSIVSRIIPMSTFVGGFPFASSGYNDGRGYYFAKDSNGGLVILDNVKRTQYLNLLSWCWEEMSRDRNERCLLVCDEAYLMIDPQVPQSLVFLRNVEKRARKYEAGLAIISHSVVDFLAPEVKMYGQALLDIPCYKILMGCDGKNLQETKDLYNLTDAEQELLESKRRGHALFIIGSKRLHVNFEIPAYKFSYMGKAGGR